MAIVERWFDVAGSGLADGTSYANRAPLLVSGAWNSIILNFNFTNDSLICYVEIGTYNTVPSLTSGSWNSTAPTLLNRVYFVAVSAGVLPTSPVGGWLSAQPAFSSVGMPVWNMDTSATFSSGGTVLNGICVVGNMASTSSGVIQSNTIINNCIIENTAAGNVLHRCTGQFYNSIFRQTGSTWNAIWSGISDSFLAVNCRFQGNAAATAGTRAGILNTQAHAHQLFYCTVTGCQTGIWHNSTASNNNSRYERLTVADNASTTPPPPPPPPQNSIVTIRGCMVTGGANGIECQSLAIYQDTRVRSTNNFVNAYVNSPTFGTLTAVGIDADEYVDAANGDYRIKAGSVYHGRNIGAGDEAAVSGGLMPVSLSGGFQN